MSGRAGRACAVCGEPARPPFRAPQPEIAPDLDMRPGEPTRSTLADWIQTCRSCGAVGPDLAALPASAASVVRSDAYRALGMESAEETLPFRRWAMIARAAGDDAAAAEALLQAGWAADDAAAVSEAAALRREVAAAWASARDAETGLRRLDVLRRAGAFEEATTWAAALAAMPLDETARLVLAFQQARIAERDIGRHLISRALPPPAHAPHVSHGRRERTGLWTRLFRRS